MREASVSPPAPQWESEVTTLKLRSRSQHTVAVRKRRARLCRLTTYRVQQCCEGPCPQVRTRVKPRAASVSVSISCLASCCGFHWLCWPWPRRRQSISTSGCLGQIPGTGSPIGINWWGFTAPSKILSERHLIKMNKGLIESSESFAGKNTREISEILISAILTSQGVCCCCTELLAQKENEASCLYLHLSVSFIFFSSFQ